MEAMDAMLAAISFLAIFVGGLGVLNTMLMAVLERTREIGTLSALGSYPSEIVAGFLKEAGLLAVIGSAIGALVSGLVSVLLLVVDIQMPPPPGRTPRHGPARRQPRGRSVYTPH